jgi:hypothetical protein
MLATALVLLYATINALGPRRKGVLLVHGTPSLAKHNSDLLSADVVNQRRNNHRLLPLSEQQKHNIERVC